MSSATGGKESQSSQLSSIFLRQQSYNECHIINLKLLCTQLSLPSLGRLLHFTNHQAVEGDLHIRISLILGISPYLLLLTVS